MEGSAQKCYTKHKKLLASLIISINFYPNYKAKTSKNRAILPIICCLNARSLNGKVDELAAFMSVHKVHIATVTETW